MLGCVTSNFILDIDEDERNGYVEANVNSEPLHVDENGYLKIDHPQGKLSSKVKPGLG